MSALAFAALVIIMGLAAALIFVAVIAGRLAVRAINLEDVIGTTVAALVAVESNLEIGHLRPMVEDAIDQGLGQMGADE